MSETDLSGCSAVDGTTRTQTLDAYRDAPIWGFTVLPKYDVGLVVMVGMPADNTDEVGTVAQYKAFPVGRCVSVEASRSQYMVEFKILRFGKCAKGVTHHDLKLMLDVRKYWCVYLQ